MQRHDQPTQEPALSSARERGLEMLLGRRADDALLTYRLRNQLRAGDQRRTRGNAA